MKQLYFILFIYACAITSVSAAAEEAQEIPITSHYFDGQYFNGPNLRDYPLYRFIGINSGAYDLYKQKTNHSIAVLKKSYNDEDLLKHFTVCTFNKWGKLIRYHDSDKGLIYPGRSIEDERRECEHLQELYNTFNKTYLGTLALNRNLLRRCIAEQEAKSTTSRLFKLEEEYHLNKLRDSLPD